MNRIPRAMLAATVLALALALVGIPMFAGCSAADDDALVVYSGRGEEFVAPVIEAFEQESGIAVDVRYGDTVDLALLLDEEGDRTPADIFLAQGPGAVGYLAAANRLGTLPTSISDLVDPRFVDAAGRWVGVSGRQRVLVYNTDELTPDVLPRRVAQLADAPFAGRVALAPGNGSFQDFVTALRTIEGDESVRAWLGALADADAPTYASNSAIVEAVGRGEVEMGLVNHYYALGFLREDPELPIANHRFAAGDPGGLFLPATASVLAGAEGDPDAEALVTFLLGEQAQRHFSDGTDDFEYPLRRGMAATQGLTPLRELDPPLYEFGDDDDLVGTARMITESGLE